MGFQGQLNSVSLTDIFQTLSMNRQTGTLIVPGVTGNQVHIYFDQGQVARCTGMVVNGKPFLLAALETKGLLTPDQVATALQQFKGNRQGLRELLLATQVIAEPDLDDVSAWCAEEMICPVFELTEGDFQFIDGPPTNEVLGYDAIDLGSLPLATPQLLMEATRRLDEWQRIREVIPDSDAYFIVDNEGRANLRNVESDPDMLKVLRYLDGRHTIMAVADLTGVTRFDCHAIVAQLVLANIARPLTPQEAVADANELRSAGNAGKARELLENTLLQFNVPEVLRPLAELCVELKDTPRAVELYLDLIQRGQDGGDLEGALGDLETILTLSPNDPDLHFDRAQTLAELSRYDEAAKAYIAAAQQYLSLRKVDQAADACHRAKNLVPRSADPHRYLAKAYLIEGQTENAIVEYKSLWHALLSDTRPKKALDELTAILDQDCKFAAVKDQVLAHAQSSEAVKTGNAVRILIYALVAVVVVTASFIGYKIIDKELLRGRAKEKLQAITSTMSADMAALKHGEVQARLQALSRDYANRPDILADIEGAITAVRDDAEKRATLDLETAKALISGGKLDEAANQLSQLNARFPETKTAIEAKQLQVTVAQLKDERNWMGRIEAANQLWKSEAWDEALGAVQALLAETEVPPKVRGELVALQQTWTTAIGSAQDLYRRAERLENLGRKLDARAGYQRATKGDGETYRARARERLIAMENTFAKELTTRMEAAFATGDDTAAFTALDELKTLAGTAATDEVKDALTRLRLPFILGVDSAHAEIQVKVKGQNDQVVKAPKNTKGPWRHELRYALGQELLVTVRRAGFSPETFRVSADGKRSRLDLALKRGPLWQTDLQAIPTTGPVISGNSILVGTSRSTLEVIDANLGGSRPVVFPDSVSEVASRPFVFKNYAFLVLDDRILCVDTDTRNPLWSWPSKDDPQQPQLQAQSLWVQEHELLPGKILIFAGTLSGRLISLGTDGAKVDIYPSSPLDTSMTGSPAVVRLGLTSTLYVPTGNQVVAFDATSPSASGPARRLYALSTRGDVIGRPAPAMVAGKPGVLVTDSTGIVVALDADPSTAKRTLGSWSLEGTPASGAIPHPDGGLAAISVAEGRVILLDLTVPGKVLGRFPAQGTLGVLAAAPVFGRNGLYVADVNGILSCINPTTAELLWKADLGSQVNTAILSHNGRIYIPTRGGSLLCFEEGELD